jgi:protein involved in polysaccharide export with SLBB domain
MRILGLTFCWLAVGWGGGQALGAQPPTEEQVRAILQTRPDLAAQVRQRIQASGLSVDQVRQRLVASGYPASLLDEYLVGEASPTVLAPPSGRVLEAIAALGIAGEDELRPLADQVEGRPGSWRSDLDTLDRRPSPVFGVDVFRRISTRFQPSTAGPVDASYRLGPGDVLVLILTGDVELAHTLEVTRDGFVVIPQVGQLYVSGLTMGQLETALHGRLRRVYSGIGRGPAATTRFQVTVSRLRTNQIYVIGEVARPGSYQVSSAGTVLTALYLAGGPSENGSFRHLEIKRGNRTIDSLDLYRYLLRGESSGDVRLETGDVVFVPTRRLPIEVDGAVVRPATYELKPGETLRQLIDGAGGFLPEALRRRIQIDRILPPAERSPGGRDRVVLDLAEDQLRDAEAPPFPLVAGDRVSVFSVATRRRNVVTVRGNVWVEGRIGFTPGMRLSEAIRLAGGPKPDTYLGQVSVSRLNPDSTRRQLRSALADSTGRVTDDLALQEDDDILVFSRTAFRPDRYVVVSGAVKRAGRIRFREGMTLRDAVLEADGVTEDALLTEAEVARIPSDRGVGTIAVTFRAALDSTYLFDRGLQGEYQGPPGVPTRPGGAAEVALRPYDNVLIFRQPDWELQRLVWIAGEVKYPGRYSLRAKTETLVEMINRAGGLTPTAYARGAELYRRLPAESGSGLRLAGRVEARRSPVPRDSVARADSVRLGTDLAQRVGLNLVGAIERPTSRENLILQSGDSVYVPEFNPTVRVLGAVNAPATILHRGGWNLDRYVSAAGGFSRSADKKRAYVVQPGGELESVTRRFVLPDGQPKPLPGAVVVVPERDPEDRKDWAGLLGSIAQILVSTVAIVVVATR